MKEKETTIFFKMDIPVLEDEIKIEYNESFETDPLCDTNVNSLINDIEDNIEDCTELQPHEEYKELNQNDIKLDGDFTECTYDDYIENATDNKVTWYESIDSTGRFLCKFCELKYSTLQTLRYHVKTKHPNHAIILKENIVRKRRNSKLICHICKQRFKEITLLKTHVHKEHSLQNIKTSCMYCDATFCSENEMSEHLIVQHNIKNKCTYICSICGYRTPTKSHYNQHQNTHLIQKTKKCKHCDYATNYSPNLKIHERIHTNEKVYSCAFANCGYRCAAKSALRSHQLKHFPDQNVLYCDKCSYKTIYRQCLKRHSDSHTRNSLRLKLT